MRDILRKAKPQRLDDLIALERALPARARCAAGWSTTSSRASRAGRRSPTSCRSCSRFSRTPTASSRTRNRSCASPRRSRASRSASPTCSARRWARRTPPSWQAQREKFVTGALKNGISEKKATKIFDLMEHFAGYGFNKSHSTTYALLAYQTAYLKANYPWHFAAALLTIEVAEHRQDRPVPGRVPRPRHPGAAARHQRERARVHGDAGRRPIRPHAIKNVGEGAIESMLAGPRGPRRAVQTRSTSSARISTCGSSTSACSRRS